MQKSNRKETTTVTRLQKLSLLYCELYGKTGSATDSRTYFFRSHSDNIDESVQNLACMGMLADGRSDHSLTEYGMKLRQYILNE